MSSSHPISLFGKPLTVKGPPLPSEPTARRAWLDNIRENGRLRLLAQGFAPPLDHNNAFGVKIRAFVGVSRFPRFDIQNILGQVANALQSGVYTDDRSVFQISAEKFLVLDSDQRTEILV